MNVYVKDFLPRRFTIRKEQIDALTSQAARAQRRCYSLRHAEQFRANAAFKVS